MESRQAQYKNVLFQRLGANWYAFVEKDGEVLYSKLPPEVDPRSDSFDLYEVCEEFVDEGGSSDREAA